MKIIQSKNLIMSIIFIFMITQLSFGQGARYTGSYTKSAPIRYDNKSNFVIEGLEISNTTEHAIALYNCSNVVIKNNRLANLDKTRGIYLYNCTNVTIIDNTFENIQTGLLASTSKGIKFEYNDVKNVLGDLKGGNRFAQMVQFNTVSGAGNSISYNVNENIAGQSAPEDIINIYNSNGTPDSPIRVVGNWIRGGGPSASGGGILLADYDGTYQLAENNILVNPGQYGIGVAGGNDIVLKNNKVFAKRNTFTNVGISACNWYAENAGPSFNITIANNQLNFTHKDGYLNNWWIYENLGTVVGKETNSYNSSLNESILPTEIFGRARANAVVTPPVEPDPVETPVETPEVEQPQETPSNIVEIPNSNIRIYRNKFDMISVKCNYKVESNSKVIVSTLTGEKLAERTLNKFNTSLYVPTTKDTKIVVTVQNGSNVLTRRII